MDDFKIAIIEEIKKHLGIAKVNLTIPPELSLGDYALPCFPFAKVLKKNPNEIALELKDKIKLEFIEKIEIKGAYLNFFVNKTNLVKEILTTVKKEKNNFGKIKLPKAKVMVEFSQANTHKAFHVGHIRGTALGESIARILDFAGQEVLRANYQGDTGMHVAKWIWCYTNFHKDEKPKKEQFWFANIYVDAIKRLNENEDLQSEVEEINRKLDEKSDKDLNHLWKTTRKICLDSMEPIYEAMNTHFDKYFFESTLENDAKNISKELIDKGIAEISEGATIVNLEKYDLGVFLMLRQDGTVLYGGKDIALAVKKFREFKIQESIYVVGKEQEHYLKQVFKVLELMNFKEYSKHVPVSLVKLPHGKMSSRTGDNILYTEFKNELLDYARIQITEKWPKLADKEVEKRALAISVATMKYSMLKQNPNKEIIFNKEDALNFIGDTGPYLQYSYARASSIIKKSTKKGKDIIPNPHEKEIKLAKTISNFPYEVKSAAMNLNPGIIANYSSKLASDFNEFYSACKVIGSDEENFRIKIVDAFRQTLKNSLSLLGIDVLEEM